MIKKYRHISFDLDGTLVHTTNDYRYALLERVLRDLSGPPPARRDIDAFWFDGGRGETIEERFHVPEKTFWERYVMLDHPQRREAHTSVYPDVEPTLHELKNRGKVLSLITSSPPWIAGMEIAKLNGAPLDHILPTRQGNFAYKPDPESMLYILQKFGLSREETVYVGNSSEDADFSRNAGVDFIYLERQEHNFHGRDTAVATIHSLTELL